MMRRLIAVPAALVLLSTTPAFAQFYNGGQTALTIAESPAHPSPGSRVHLSAESPLLDLAASDVEWTVNGVPAGKGESIDITAGKLGQASHVAVSVTGASGNDSASLTIIPASVDLLWEADSYTPPFYEGRALPSSGSTIRLYAIPHILRSSGVEVPASNLTFTWKNNGAVLQADSGVGKSSATIPAAILLGSDVITVDAQTADGTLSGEASVAIQTIDPHLVLYESSPLFGILYHRALQQNDSATDAETTFTAVPYFADALTARDPNLSYEWRINDSPVANDPKDPNEVTVSSQAVGTAQINLNLSSPRDPFVAANGSWTISFGNTASPQDAFNSTQ